MLIRTPKMQAKIEEFAAAAKRQRKAERRMLKAIQGGNADEEAVHRKEYLDAHFEALAHRKEYERMGASL